MELRDRRNQAEAEATAGCAAAGLQSVEALNDPVALRLRDAGAVIPNDEYGGFSCRAERQAYASVCAAENGSKTT